MESDNTLSPYPGPRPFEEGMRKIFYGRDQELSELLALILSHRIILLYAQSAAGKTSLLQAGLIPMLKDSDFDVLPTARVGGHIPGSTDTAVPDNLFILNTLLSWSGGKAGIPELMSQSIPDFLKNYRVTLDEDGFPKSRILIFDQFEELFTWYPEHWSKREFFFRSLSEALEEDESLRLLFVIREDFIANLHPYAEILPGHFKTQYRLERLSPANALKAIESPLLGTSLSFCEGVAAELVKELQKIQITTPADEIISVPGDYIEPVQLQVVCKKLWSSLHGKVNCITHEHLRTIGNVNTALGDYYEEALSDTAHRTRINEVKIRQWFENELITTAGTRGTVFQGKSHTGSLSNHAVKILEDNHHLVRAEFRAGAHWFELTHDRFVNPILDSNQLWRRIRRKRHRKIRIMSAISLIPLLMFFSISMNKYIDYQRQSKKIEQEIRKLEDEPDSLRIAVFRNAVSYYFRVNRNNRSFKKLTSILRDNENLIPRNYYKYFSPQDTSTYTNITGDWPLILEFNPERQLDLKQFQVEWYNIAVSINTALGIPAPLRIKLVQNPSLQRNTFRLLTQSYKPYDTAVIYKITERNFRKLKSVDNSIKVILEEFRSQNREFSNKEELISQVTDRIKQKFPQSGQDNINSGRLSNIGSELNSADKKAIMDGTDSFMGLSFYVPIPSGNFLFRESDGMDDRLNRFFRGNPPEITTFQQFKDGRTWYSVPLWTIPLLYEAGIFPYPGEYSLVLMLLNKLVENPHFLLSPECVNYIINSAEKTSPLTVKEALINRGGIDGIQKDLTEIIRAGFPVKPLEYTLDVLAKYSDPPSLHLAKGVITEIQQNKENLDIRLKGKQLPAQQPDLFKDKLNTSFNQVYEEAGRLHPSDITSVKITIGNQSPLFRIFFDKENKDDGVIEKTEELKGSIYKNFGITVPGPEFHEDKLDLYSSGFGIDVLNQNFRYDGGTSPSGSKDSSLTQLTGRLEHAYRAYRTWWINPEIVSKVISRKSEGIFTSPLDNTNLAAWLLEKYTLTDLKLILRAIIAPGHEEQNLYETSADSNETPVIPAENTLLDIKWLLGSLIYWLNTGTDPLNLQAVSGKLRQTQAARINMIPLKQGNNKITALISQGISALSKGQWNTASASFRKAVALNPEEAENIFLKLYARQSRFAPGRGSEEIEKLCSLNIPGNIPNITILDSADLYNLEILLNSGDRTYSNEFKRQADLYLLGNYTYKQFYKRSNIVIDSLLNQHGRQEWSADDEYILAYNILDNYKENIARTQRLEKARSLLQSVYLKWYNNLTDNNFNEQVFIELMNLFINRYAYMNWYWNYLDSLADLRPENVGIQFDLGYGLCYLSEGYNELIKGLELLNYVESNISRFSDQEQDRIIAWINWYRANAYFKIARYGKEDQQLAKENALRLLNNLKALKPPPGENWPSQENIYSSIISLYILDNDFRNSLRVLNEGLRECTKTDNLLFTKFFHELVRGEIAEALMTAETVLETVPENSQSDALFILSVAQFLNDTSDFGYTAIRSMKSEHDYKDYIRMMLFTDLVKKNKSDEAQKLIDERWEEIDTLAWRDRLGYGDRRVWREMLTGYYAGKLNRDFLFKHLEDPEKFDSGPLSRLNIPRSGLLCEAYFYDALFQGITGEPETRMRRMNDGLEKVLETRYYDYYEYHMARYLLSKSIKTGKTPLKK